MVATDGRSSLSKRKGIAGQSVEVHLLVSSHLGYRIASSDQIDSIQRRRSGRSVLGFRIIILASLILLSPRFKSARRGAHISVQERASIHNRALQHAYLHFISLRFGSGKLADIPS